MKYILFRNEVRWIILKLQSCERVCRIVLNKTASAGLGVFGTYRVAFILFIFRSLWKRANSVWIDVVGRTARPNTSQFRSLKSRRTTFLNYIKFANLLILRLQNCEMFGQKATSWSVLAFFFSFLFFFLVFVILSKDIYKKRTAYSSLIPLGE